MAASIYPDGLRVKNEEANDGKIRGNAGKIGVNTVAGLDAHAALHGLRSKNHRLSQWRYGVGRDSEMMMG
jgi:hypothetical protein